MTTDDCRRLIYLGLALTLLLCAMLLGGTEPGDQAEGAAHGSSART